MYYIMFDILKIWAQKHKYHFLFPYIVLNTDYIIRWYSSICKYRWWPFESEGDKRSTTDRSTVISSSERWIKVGDQSSTVWSVRGHYSTLPVNIWGCKAQKIKGIKEALGCIQDFVKGTVIGRDNNRKMNGYITWMYSFASGRFLTSHLPKLIRTVAVPSAEDDHSSLLWMFWGMCVRHGRELEWTRRMCNVRCRAEHLHQVCEAHDRCKWQLSINTPQCLLHIKPHWYLVYCP